MNLPENDLRIPEAAIEAAAKAMCDHDARFERWDQYTSEAARDPYRRRARAALSAAFREMGFEEEGPSEPEIAAARDWLDHLCTEVLDEPEPFDGRDAWDDARALLTAVRAVRRPWLPVESERQDKPC